MDMGTTGEVAPGRSRHDGDRAVRAGDRGLGLLVGSTVLRITITRSLLGGKLMAQFLGGVGRILLMFIFGALVFNVNLGGSPLGLLLVTLTTCWATTSLGILLVAVIRSRKQIHPITTLVILGSSAIGGAWFPLFMMPKLLQQIARITLVGWAVEGYNRLMILGGSLADVWMDIGVLVLYGAVCFAIGLKLFSFKEG